MSRTKSVLGIGLLPRKSSALNRVEISKMDALLQNTDLGAPLSFALIPHNSGHTGRVGSRQTQISHVRGGTGFVKVGPAVVATNAVFVVDFPDGPLACFDQPSHSVREILASKYRALSVSLVGFCRERFSISVSCIPSLPLGLRAEVMDCAPLPKQTPGFGIVGEKLTDLFRFQVGSI